MKKIFVLFYIVLTFGLIYLYQHRPTYVEVKPPEGVDERLWRRGRAMYNARCTSCHNPNPNLPGSVGPALRGAGQELIVDRLTNGKGAMPVQKDMVRFAKAFREYLK